jgi:hypothetical protein
MPARKGNGNCMTISHKDCGDWIPACAGMTVRYMGMTLKNMGGMLQLFGNESEHIINELNEALAA